MIMSIKYDCEFHVRIPQHRVGDTIIIVMSVQVEKDTEHLQMFLASGTALQSPVPSLGITFTSG